MSGEEWLYATALCGVPTVGRTRHIQLLCSFVPDSMCLELEITLEALYSINNTKFKTSLMTILIYIRLLCISNMVYFMKKIKRKKTQQFSVEMIFLIVNFIFYIFKIFWASFSTFTYFCLLFLFNYFSVIIKWIKICFYKLIWNGTINMFRQTKCYKKHVPTKIPLLT